MRPARPTRSTSVVAIAAFLAMLGATGTALAADAGEPGVVEDAPAAISDPAPAVTTTAGSEDTAATDQIVADAAAEQTPAADASMGSANGSSTGVLPDVDAPASGATQQTGVGSLPFTGVDPRRIAFVLLLAALTIGAGTGSIVLARRA